MKIVFIIKSFAMKAGVERLMSDKMNYMAEQGHEITLVTYEQGTHPMPFALHPSITHIDLNTRFFTLKKYALLRRIIEIIRLQRIFKKKIQCLINDIQPDIIHTTTYSINLIGILLNLKTSAKRTIESQVSYDSILKENDFKGKGILQTIARKYDTNTFNKLKIFDAFFALTKGDARQWMKYVPTVHVIPNPLTSYPKQIKGHNETHHRIICAGRLNYQKGFDLLIEAFSLIADQCPAWHIDIFGSGDEEQALRKQLSQKGLEQRIFIHPASDHIFDEFQDSDFFVFSSRFEGWGLVLVEAMSCGIPAVSYRCDYGPEDIITNQKDGLLVTNGNIKELSEKILWMIEHCEERLTMGKEARHTARKFLKEKVIQQWIDVFYSLLK